MECDRGDSFPFDFEPNWFPFGSKSKRKLSLRSHAIQYERKNYFPECNIGLCEQAVKYSMVGSPHLANRGK